MQILDHGLIADGRPGVPDRSPVLRVTAKPTEDDLTAWTDARNAAVLDPLREVVSSWRSSDVYARLTHLTNRRQAEQRRLVEAEAEADALAEKILESFTSDTMPDKLEAKRELVLTQAARLRERVASLGPLVDEAQRSAEQMLRLDLQRRIVELRGSFRRELAEATDTFQKALTSYGEVCVAAGALHGTTDARAQKDIVNMVWPDELPAREAPSGTTAAPVPPPGEAYHVGADYSPRESDGRPLDELVAG